MKIWQEFGSSHSGNVTVIGTFASPEKAQEAYEIIDDFVRAFWEERYSSVNEFKSRWRDRVPNIEYLGPNQDDFEIGIDNDPDVRIDENKVIVSSLRSENVHGIIKLLFRKAMEKIEISGHGA